MILSKIHNYERTPQLREAIINYLPSWMINSEEAENRVEVFDIIAGRKLGKGIFEFGEEIQFFESKILSDPEWIRFQEYFGIHRYFFGFSFSVLPKGVHYGKHIDQPINLKQTYNVSLNIPILNCENSKIEHYNLQSDQIDRYMLSNNIEKQHAASEDFTVLSSVETKNQIYSLRTDIIHDVISDHKDTRVVLACRLDKDIIPTIESLGVD